MIFSTFLRHLPHLEPAPVARFTSLKVVAPSCTASRISSFVTCLQLQISLLFPMAAPCLLDCSVTPVWQEQGGGESFGILT